MTHSIIRAALIGFVFGNLFWLPRAIPLLLKAVLKPYPRQWSRWQTPALMLMFVAEIAALVTLVLTKP